MAVGTPGTAGYREQTIDLITLNREDLLDLIVMISPEDTPFFSSVDHGSANGTTHEWGTDALAAAASNRHVEGADATYPALDDRGRDLNWTQIFTNSFAVSRTQERVLKAGMKSEVAYQSTKKMKEHKLDVEWAVFNNATAGDAGAGDGDRLFQGIKAFISAAAPDHVGLPGGGANTVLLEADLNIALENVWTAGGNPQVVMCSARIKRRVTGFSTNVTRSLEMTQNAERRQINRIDVYEGDFGTVRVVPNRQIPITTGTGGSTDVYVFELDKFRMDFLQPTMIEEFAKTGDATKRWVYSEVTLVGLAVAASFVYETVLNST